MKFLENFLAAHKLLGTFEGIIYTFSLYFENVPQVKRNSLSKALALCNGLRTTFRIREIKESLNPLISYYQNLKVQKLAVLWVFHVVLP